MRCQSSANCVVSGSLVAAPSVLCCDSVPTKLCLLSLPCLQALMCTRESSDAYMLLQCCAQMTFDGRWGRWCCLPTIACFLVLSCDAASRGS